MQFSAIRSCRAVPKIRGLTINRGSKKSIAGAEDLRIGELQFVATTSPTQLDMNSDMLFGQVFSDHMLEADWVSGKGWGAPRVVPLDFFRLHPACSALHYGVQCFEGLKAYRSPKDQRIRIYRPLNHLQRLAKSCARIALPVLDPEITLEVIEELVRIEERFVPLKPGFSMYLRPTMISNTSTLGVTPAQEAKFYVLCNPCGPYFKEGFKPVSLLADPAFVRAWPGGAGNTKVGTNYGPCMVPQMLAQKSGYNQPMWLFPLPDGDYEVTEAGTLNLFVLLRKDGVTQLVTPSLSDLILPGISRASVIELAQETLPEPLRKRLGDIEVVEKRILMSELLSALQKGEVLEFFGTGTAANVVSIHKFAFQGVEYNIPIDPEDPSAGGGPLCLYLRKRMADIQYGLVDHPWGHIVDV